jgi:hypothetical protein
MKSVVACGSRATVAASSELWAPALSVATRAAAGSPKRRRRRPATSPWRPASASSASASVSRSERASRRVSAASSSELPVRAARAHDVGRRGLDGAAAERRHDAGEDLGRQLRAVHEAPGLVEIAPHRAARHAHVHHRARTAADLEDARVQPQPPDRLRQAVVVREDDDLARGGGAV